jgi:hypothetical protein
MRQLRRARIPYFRDGLDRGHAGRPVIGAEDRDDRRICHLRAILPASNARPAPPVPTHRYDPAYWVGVTSYQACRIVNNYCRHDGIYTSTMSTRVSVPGPAPQHGIGVIAPFDLALDRELWRWTPADVSLYVTRTPFVAGPVNIELAEAISDDITISERTRDVLAVQPRVVSYACTSGSFAQGLAGERHVVTAMREAGLLRR